MSFKIKTISRKEEDYLKDTPKSRSVIFRNSNVLDDGFTQAREYSKALKAAKMKQMFSQPFVAALAGHCDGIYSLAKHPNLINLVLSASTDGIVKIYDIAERVEQVSIQAHRGWVTGTAFSRTNPNQFYTSSLDGTMKLWSINGLSDHITGIGEKNYSPLMSYEVPFGSRCFDMNCDNTRLVSGGEAITLFDPTRNDPIANLRWGFEEIQTVSFSPSEPDLFAVGDSGCNLTLYDVKLERPTDRNLMRGRVNKVKFNPQYPHEFLVASEDYNIYRFDIRNTKRPVSSYTGHTNAVLDVDYSPTGTKFVSSSFDESLRVWEIGARHSTDTFFTRRMTKVHCCLYTNDDRYLISGSLDANVRIWKAKADDSLKILNKKESRAVEERRALIKKFEGIDEVRRIQKSKTLPKHIRTATHRTAEQNQAKRAKVARINEASKTDLKVKTVSQEAVVESFK